MTSERCSKRTWRPAIGLVARPLARRETPSCRRFGQRGQKERKAALAANEHVHFQKWRYCREIQFPTTATKTTNSDTLAALLFSSASLGAHRLRQADWGADDHDH